MDQRTHAWIAIRALKLLESENQIPGLIKLIKPHVKKASIGAWIPDKRDAKLGGAKTQNHVFKIKPYDGPLKSRFIVPQKKFLGSLGPDRLITSFIKQNDALLDKTWWSQSYKADPSPGQHLANRAMSLSINIIDMLILGDDPVQNLVPGDIEFIDIVGKGIKCSAGQIAIFFFMLSHFVADSLMPCHCDERDLSDYDNGLHKELEKYWSKRIGASFSEKSLMKTEQNDNEILDQAEAVDKKFDLQFNNGISGIKSKDVWEETVMLCRASFAVASIIAPYTDYKYKPATQKRAPFDELFKQDDQGEKLLAQMSQVIMHDAVLNVAMFWKDIWTKFS